MSFIVGAVIGTVGAIAGGAMAAKGAKRGAEIAAAGGDREIEFNRESRDLVREDQAPYRKAGYKALDALMSLTGLGASAGGPAPMTQRAYNPYGNMPGYKRRQLESNSISRRSAYEEPAKAPDTPMSRGYITKEEREAAFAKHAEYLNQWPNSRAGGGAMHPEQRYNINELGPESVYTGGSYTRNPNPMTIDGQTGYVQPNIQGRALGGFTEDIGVGGPYGGLPNRPPPTPVQAPPGQAYQPPQTGANTTAINPQTGYPNENPGGVEGGYQFQTEPGYQFRFEEGQRALDRGAAARGGLLSGGYARKAIRYGQGFASNEYTNVYNRIANIAGLGQTANQASGNAALQAGAYMGNAASNAANASAYGQIQAGNAWANAGNQIAQLPWGNVFKPKTANNTSINNAPN